MESSFNAGVAHPEDRLHLWYRNLLHFNNSKYDSCYFLAEQQAVTAIRWEVCSVHHVRQFCMLNTGADAHPIVNAELINAIVFTNCIHNCHSLGLSPFKLSHSHYYPLSRARVPCQYFACDVILAHSECSFSDLLSIANVAEGPPQLLHSDSYSQSSRSKETVLEARLLKHW